MLPERSGEYLHSIDLPDAVELKLGSQKEHLPVEEAPSRDQVRLRQVVELLAEELSCRPTCRPAGRGLPRQPGPDRMDGPRSCLAHC